MSRKVRRGQKLVEWTRAEDHLTVDGLREFDIRQKQRLAAAQPRPVPDNVEALPAVRTVRRRGRA